MYKVEGYEFETKEQAKLAQKEAAKVRYIKDQTSMDDPDVVLRLYNKLVMREVFVTPVGRGFLRELQEYLNTIPYIKNEDILPIPVFQPQPVEIRDAREEEEARQRARKRNREKAKMVMKARQQKYRDYRKLFHISTFFAVVFAIGIIGMFLITYLSADNVNMINYENEVINKYETWQQQLDEREAELNRREMELEQQEEKTWDR